MLTQDLEEVRAASNQKPNSQSSNQCNDQNEMSFCPKFQIFATIVKLLSRSIPTNEEARYLKELDSDKGVCVTCYQVITILKIFFALRIDFRGIYMAPQLKLLSLDCLRMLSSPALGTTYKTKHSNYIEKLDI